MSHACRRLEAWVPVLLLGLALPAAAQGPVHTPRVHALTNARVVQAPGRVLPRATVLIRDGLIEAIGPGIAVPADARVWDLDSLTVYPGLIDLAMPVGRVEGGGDDAKSPPSSLAHPLAVVHPEAALADGFELKATDRDARRKEGILTVRALPDAGVFRGRAAVLNLGDGDLRANILTADAGQVLAFTGARGENEYPNSTMGTVAAIRQTLSDALWKRDADARYAASPRGLARPEGNAALDALRPALDGREPLIFMTDDVLDVLRADTIAREFGLTFQYVGSGEEYKRLDDVKATAGFVAVPVDFPKAPKAGNGLEALAVSTQELRHWNAAPSNPARLHEAGVAIALTADGLSDPSQFRANVAKAIDAGLPRDAALAACTTVPAGVLGLSPQLGTLEPGKIANLVVVDGELFADSTKVRAVWVDGDRYEIEDVKPPEGDPRGTWDFTVAMPDRGSYAGTLTVAGDIGALTGTATILEQDVPATLSQSGATLTVSFPTDGLGAPGMARLTVTLSGDSADGAGTSPFGVFTVTMTRTAKPEEDLR